MSKKTQEVITDFSRNAFPYDEQRQSAIEHGGREYHAVTVINDPNNPEIATSAAESFRALNDKYSHDFYHSGLRGAVARTRLQRGANKVLSVAHQQFEGNTELANIDLESGIVEPDDNITVARQLTNDILSGAAKQ